MGAVVADLVNQVHANDGAPAQDLAEEAAPSAPIKWDPFALIGASVRRGSSAWQQFRISTSRYVESMIGDRTHLLLLLLQAPIIAFLLTLVAKTAEGHAAAAMQVSASTEEQSAACEQMTSASTLLLTGSRQLKGLVGELRTQAA